MTQPNQEAWVDSQFSAELPVLRARGEGQRLEYMEVFPSNLQELAKEIAAFATAGGGTILLGVTDDGELYGLSECDTISSRDSLVRRLEGICHGPIQPAITPSIAFGTEAGLVVLAVTVPKGDQPIYYCNGKPYIRHLSQSRPADPHEVIALVRSWLGYQPEPDAAPVSAAVQSVIGACVDAIEAHATVNDRMLTPYFEQLQAQLRYVAERFRRAAADDELRSRGFAPVLTEGAVLADRVANFHAVIGMGPAFRELVGTAADAARDLYSRLIAELRTGPAEYEIGKRSLLEHARELRVLADQALQSEPTIRLRDLQDQVSLLGFYVLHLTYGPLRGVEHGSLEAIRSTARQTYQINTTRLSVDGGRSQRRLLETVDTVASQLLELAETLP